MIKNNLFTVVLFLFFATAHAGEPTLNTALNYFVEGAEAEGRAALQIAAAEGDRIAVLLHHVKGMQPIPRDLNYPEPLDPFQTVEVLFWKTDYLGAMLKTYIAEREPQLPTNLRAWRAAAWFMTAPHAHIDDMDNIVALYYLSVLESNRDDLRIEKAIAQLWRGDTYNIDWALAELKLVQDPEYLQTAELLSILFKRPDFKVR